MYSQSLKTVQVETYHSDHHRKRHRKRLVIAKKPVLAIGKPSPTTLKSLHYPVFLVKRPSKHGRISSLVMHTPQAAVALFRTDLAKTFTVLGKARHQGRWKRTAETLPAGSLAEATNTAQAFLKANTKEAVADGYYQSVASDRSIQLLRYLSLGLPHKCTSGVVSGLIHAKYLAAAYDAAYAKRPRINGVEACEISFPELERSL